MELFLIGLVSGFALTVLGVVVWNLQSASSVDAIEEEIRKVTPEFTEAKEKVKRRIRKVVE